MFKRFAFSVLGLALAGCGGPNADEPVQLEWNTGDVWYLQSTYRIANVRTEESTASLDGALPSFGENWSEDIVWTYQVVDDELTPDPSDELFRFAERSDGTVTGLTVIRAYVDGTLNTDPEILEADPVIYLVFRAERNRLAGIVSFVNVDGERVETAYSSEELGKSWSTLSQSNLVAAPTYLAPWGFRNESNERILENGSFMATEVVDDATVAVVFDDELGGGTVATEYETGKPWPTWTVSDNVEAKLLTEGEVDALRSSSPWLYEDPPPDYDFRAALASSINIEGAFTLDEQTIEGGWTAFTPNGYQPWNGSWWPQSSGKLIFGYDSRATISDEIKDEIDPIKKAMDNLSEELRDMEDGEEKEAKRTEYGEKQDELVEIIVDFYNGVLADLDGGKINVDNGTISHADDGWSYELDELSPLDKMALRMYSEGRTSPNPFYTPAWEILNHYSPAGGSWWGHCNGWAAAAILTHEPTESKTVEILGQDVEFTTADQKGVLSESHYSTYSRFYGSRYYKEGDDRADLTPQAFHQLMTFYTRDQLVPGVFDTDSGEQVWNFPFYGAELQVEETTVDQSNIVNVNTADLARLETLNGIGPALGQRIIDYREENGAFQSVDELVDVKGIGNATLEDIRADVTIDALDTSRTFEVVAEVFYATDGVGETHVDNGPPDARGFTKTYRYTLVTDADGTVLEGNWDNIENHPDFMWVPYNNPLTASSGSSENPFMPYNAIIDTLGDDIIRQ